MFYPYVAFASENGHLAQFIMLLVLVIFVVFGWFWRRP